MGSQIIGNMAQTVSGTIPLTSTTQWAADSQKNQNRFQKIKALYFLRS
jgi:hypothetical protein